MMFLNEGEWLFLKEQIARFIDNSNTSITSSLRQHALGKLPNFVNGIKNLDGGEVGHSVVPAHHVEHVVNHDGCCVASWGVHVGHMAPLAGVGVVPLDAAADIGTIVATNSVEEVVHDGHCSTTAALQHGVDVGPLVSARVVTFD